MPKISVSKLLAQANSHTKKGQFVEAEKLYAEILMSFPNNIKAQKGLRNLSKVSSTVSAETPPQHAVDKLICLVNEEKFGLVVAQASNLLAHYPKAVAVLNILGISSAQVGQLDQAIKAFEKIITLTPNEASAYYNLGNVFKDKAQIQKAVDAYSKALELRPDYDDAFNNLTVAIASQDNNAGPRQRMVLEKYQQVQALSKKNADRYFEAGLLLMNQSKFDAAVKCFKKAIEASPFYPEAYNSIGNVLRIQGELQAAVEAFGKALSINPSYADAYSNLAAALNDQGRTKEAEEACKVSLSMKPDNDRAYTNMGNALIAEGKTEAAIAAYRKALLINPKLAVAYKNLSALVKFLPNDPLISKIQALLSCKDLSKTDRCYLHYANAKINEDIGNFGDAFDNYVSGGKLRQSLLSYEFTQDKHLFHQIKSVAPQFLEITDKLSFKMASYTPIFILGMPRSGTTLVEQIVSAHTNVSGAGELSFASKYGTGLAIGLTKINALNIKDFRIKYLSEIAKYAHEKSYVTDKMPQNFLLIPLICAAFPEAKLIHVRRNAAATCWSNFKHYFSADNLGYSYDISDTVKYYELYSDLMNFCYELYGDRIHTIDYDKRTDSQEPEIKRLINCLGLPWEDTCLTPEENLRTVITASQQQVRKKIYKGSSLDWLKYQSYLGDLFENLH